MVRLDKWMSHMIDRNFLPHEARIIKSITLSESVPLNLMIWSNSKDGRYRGLKKQEKLL